MDTTSTATGSSSIDIVMIGRRQNKAAAPGREHSSELARNLRVFDGTQRSANLIQDESDLFTRGPILVSNSRSAMLTPLLISLRALLTRINSLLSSLSVASSAEIETIVNGHLRMNSYCS